jgi:Uma2 family endonuclease
MNSGPKKPATPADLEALPEHVVGEIIDGELVVTPRPASPHAYATSNLSYELMGPFSRGREGPGGWWILIEPELSIGADVLVADLAAWRHSRMPVVPQTPRFALPPDWVCEVLSPATARIDRAVKLRIYAAHGMDHAWLVDPIIKTLEVLRREDRRWLVVDTFQGEQLVRAEPFEELALDLRALWLPEVHDSARS